MGSNTQRFGASSPCFSRLIAVVAAGLVLAACSGSAANGLTSGAVTDGVGASDSDGATATTVPGASASDGRDPEPGTLTSMLARIPLAAAEAAAEADTGMLQVSIVDVNAASVLAGLDRPSPSDVEASLEWLSTLTLGQTAGSGGSGFAITLPQFPDPSRAAFVDEVRTEIGFSIIDIDRSIALTALPVEFAVVEGSEIALAPTLSETDGILSAGTGEDYRIDVEARTAARPLGRPLRLATLDGLVAASRSTPLVEAWLAGGPTLADDPELSSVTAALDTAGTVDGHVFVDSFAPFVGGEVPSMGLPARFGAVGIGTTAIDGRPASAMVYVFADEASAEASLGPLERAWREGMVETSAVPVSDLFTVSSAERIGRSVLIVATVSDEITSRRPLMLLIQRNPLFTND